MICDIRQVNGSLSADLCIVGGGAAGLSLAHELAAKGWQIVVLEAGGRNEQSSSQDFLKGEVDDTAHPAPEHYRVRALGGSSRAWGGGCVPFDPIDFEDRPWLGATGWPIPYGELAQYYPAAMEAAEAGPLDMTPPSPLVRKIEGPNFTTLLERFSRPTNFGVRWSPALTRAQNVKVLLNAAVTGIRTASDGASVAGLDVAAPDGRKIDVTARTYVLACGGIEAPRLLLASTGADPNGLGNRHGWVGRGYMCHVAAVSGHVRFNGPIGAVPYQFEHDGARLYFRRRLALSEDAQRRMKVLNLAFRLQRQDGSDPAHGDALLSLIHLYKTFKNDPYSQVYRETASKSGDLGGHFLNLIKGPHRLAAFAAATVKGRYLDARRYPGLPYRNRDNRFAIEFHGEQAPNWDSRIALADSRDRHGTRRVRVEWRAGRLDVETVQQAYRLLANDLEASGAGSVEFSEEQLESQIRHAGAYGGHHIGATRMSNRPEDGVVDTDCRVHGVDNLYIASASVMPTSGQANPTLTILALTYRLGAHLERRLSATAIPTAVPAQAAADNLPGNAFAPNPRPKQPTPADRDRFS